jgi:predicted RecB family nuclease
MDKQGPSYKYSPSDLIRFLDNPCVTWVDWYNLEYPETLERDKAKPDEELIWRMGNEHETAFVQTLAAEGRDVADMKGSRSLQATMDQMRAGREIIYQARLELGEFAGFADFLVRVEGTSELGSYYYEVWDTKLARNLKPYFAIQLCCYAEMLEVLQGRLPPEFGVVLGSGDRQKLKTDDYFFYYRAIKRAFLDQQYSFRAEDPPLFPGLADYGHWTGYVTQMLNERDDLSLIANIRTVQIKKLHATGITTVHQLAEAVTLDTFAHLDINVRAAAHSGTIAGRLDWKGNARLRVNAAVSGSPAAGLWNAASHIAERSLLRH